MELGWNPPFQTQPEIPYFFKDKPKVSITRLADAVVEEGKAAVTLTCKADANPPARIYWRKLGSTEERRFVESLEFNPVQRKDSGTYVCQAENSIGVSKEEAAEVNVLCEYAISYEAIYESKLNTLTKLKAKYN